MSKSNYFSTKSVFGQLISLIDDSIITNTVHKHQSDRYTKRFKTKDHLISMLFCAFAKCNSLREVSGAMLGLSGKTANFQLNHIPKRSTLSDANKNRTVEVFATIYNPLFGMFQIRKESCSRFAISNLYLRFPKKNMRTGQNRFVERQIRF